MRRFMVRRVGSSYIPVWPSICGMRHFMVPRVVHQSQKPPERTLTQPVAFFFWTPAGAASLPDQEVPFGGAEKGVWPPSGRSTHWPPSENVTRSTLGGSPGSRQGL